jgi:hypothetical protein
VDTLEELEFRRREHHRSLETGSGSVEHGQPKHPPTENTEDGEEIHQAFGGT